MFPTLSARSLAVCVISPLLVLSIAVAGTASAHDRDRRSSNGPPHGTTSPSSQTSLSTPSSSTSPSSVPTDTAAEIAAWTRLVQEGQRRVFELTGAHVPLPGPSSNPSASSSPDPSSSPYPELVLDLQPLPELVPVPVDLGPGPGNQH